MNEWVSEQTVHFESPRREIQCWPQGLTGPFRGETEVVQEGPWHSRG